MLIIKKKLDYKHDHNCGLFRCFPDVGSSSKRGTYKGPILKGELPTPRGDDFDISAAVPQDHTVTLLLHQPTNMVLSTLFVC